jgi:MFS family permease
MPIGQLAYGPLAAAFGVRPVLVASAVAYVAVVGLVLCSRSVRELPRAPATPTEPVTSATP